MTSHSLAIVMAIRLALQRSPFIKQVTSCLRGWVNDFDSHKDKANGHPVPIIKTCILQLRNPMQIELFTEITGLWPHIRSIEERKTKKKIKLIKKRRR